MGAPGEFTFYRHESVGSSLSSAPAPAHTHTHVHGQSRVYTFAKDAKGDFSEVSRVLNNTDLLYFSGDDSNILPHLAYGIDDPDQAQQDERAVGIPAFVRKDGFQSSCAGLQACLRDGVGADTLVTYGAEAGSSTVMKKWTEDLPGFE